MSYFRSALGATPDPAAACRAAGDTWVLKPFGQSACNQTVRLACTGTGGQWLGTRAGFYCYKDAGTVASGAPPAAAIPMVGEEAITVVGRAPAKKGINWKVVAPILAVGALGFLYFATKKPKVAAA